MSDGFNPLTPLAEATALPKDYYLDPHIVEIEYDQLFRSSWHYIGRTDQFSGPGDYVATRIGLEPLLVVRDESGQLRGMINVCRHRAARVTTTETGTVRRFQCRYHGWTYNLRGELKGAPEMDRVANFCKEQHGLPPVHVASWGPWVFAQIEPPKHTLTELLDPFPDRVTPFRIDQLQWYARRTYDVACNWKVYVDNYLDGGYHVHGIHAGLADVLDYAHYGTQLFAFASEQSSPLKAVRSSQTTSETSSDPSPTGMDQNATLDTRRGERAAYWWFHPNFMVNLYDGVMDTNLVIPIAVNRCRVVFDFYFTPECHGAFAEKSIAVAEQIQEEDRVICEEVQLGMASRSYRAGRYSVRRESGVHHFHQLLMERTYQIGSRGPNSTV